MKRKTPPARRNETYERMLKKDQEREKKKEYEKQLSQDFNLVFGTDEGIRVLREISRMCNYNQESVVVNSIGTFDQELTNRNIHLESFYKRLRRKITNGTLKKAEFN